jgi:hypothetical protein
MLFSRLHIPWRSSPQSADKPQAMFPAASIAGNTSPKLSFVCAAALIQVGSVRHFQ